MCEMMHGNKPGKKFSVYVRKPMTGLPHFFKQYPIFDGESSKKVSTLNP